MTLDSVNKKLEFMVPELEDLFVQNIFSRDEINNIIKKRREFEYSLTSASRTIGDYISYSRYEMNLELLKRKRIQRLELKNLSFTIRGIWAKRLEKILQRALKKFPLDIQLWYQYFEFCIISNRVTLGKWFSKAILIHPYQPQFWIWAANWEYSHNKQIAVARKLFHRALRLMPKEKKLYLEYCRLEILFATDVREQIEPQYESTDISGLSQTGFSDMENFVSLIDSSVNHPQSSDPILQFQIPRIIYNHAIQHYPDDIHFHKQFLWLFEEFGNTKSLQELVNEQVKTHLSHLPQARIFTISFPYRNDIIPKECFKKLDAILAEEYSPELLLETIHFCSYHLEKGKNQKAYLGFIQNLWEKIESGTADWVLSEKILFALAHLLLRLGQLEIATNALKKSTEDFPENSETWYQYINLLKTLSSDKEKENIEDVFQEALSRENISLSLLLLYLEYCLSNENTDKIMEKYKTTLESHHYSKEELQKYSESVLDLLLNRAEAELIRKIYTHTFSYFPATCSFHLKCAHWEATSFESPDANTIRNIYRYAVNRYGKTEPEVWLKWIEFESNEHQISTAGTLFWEAKKTLEPSFLQAFLVSHSSWLNSTDTTMIIENT